MVDIFKVAVFCECSFLLNSGNVDISDIISFYDITCLDSCQKSALMARCEKGKYLWNIPFNVNNCFVHRM